MNKAISLIVASLVGLAIGTAATWASVDRGPGEVTTFNSGFSDSKLDDCQQGFAPACKWLSSK